MDVCEGDTTPSTTPNCRHEQLLVACKWGITERLEGQTAAATNDGRNGDVMRMVPIL